MRRLLHIVLCASLILAALSACDHKPDEGAVAAQSAKVYYDYLLHHDYKSFVAGSYYPDSIPGIYREQLETNAKMILAQQDSDHKGLKEVIVDKGVADTARHTADAFLVLVYGDSTRERIVVPMVKHNEVWMMR